MSDSDTLTARENWQTPEQHAAGLEFQRAHDTGKRKLCDFMQFWRFCADKACLRSRGCRGNPHTCFDVFWPQVPEEIQNDIRAMICEAAGRPEQAQSYRRAAEEIRPEIAAHENPAESGTPGPDAAPPHEAHMPRIRTL